MTVVCSGGASAARSGFGERVYVTAAAVEAAIELILPGPLGLLLAPFIASEAYDLTTFCTVDPPADPGLTAQDLIDVTNFVDPTVSIPAIVKARQWFNSWFWYRVCECTSTTTPSAPTPSDPGNQGAPNPGLPSGTSGNQCWSATSTDGYSVFDNPILAYDTLLWQDGVSGHVGTSVRNLPSPLPSIVSIEGTINASGAHPPTNVYLQIYWTNSGGGTISEIHNTDTHPTAKLHDRLSGAPPAGAVSATFIWGLYGPVTHPATGTYTAHCDMVCSGSASTPSTPCCPPDPMVELRFQQIIGMLTSIFQSLPAQLSSYATGTVHAGLSGNGHLTLVGAALAALVTITTDPTTLGSDLADPLFLFDRGFITPLINYGPVRGETRLVHNPQVYLLPALTEEIGYSLHPGVTVSITELLRGP